KKIGPFESTTWNLSRLKTLALGGERIDPTIMESFVATFKKTGLEVGVMAPGYGLGEHVTIVSLGGRRFYHADRMALTHQNKIKPGTHTLVGCGEPVKGVDVRIVHPDTCMEVSSDQVGEIWVNSACKATGYIHQEEQNKEVFYAQLKGDDASKSYLRTGDLGFIKEGELFVCGRIKNMINVRGTNFYPIDIEEALVSIPSVSGCMAFPHLSEEEEEGIAIAVEINASENIKTEDQMNGLIQEVSEKTLMNVGVAPETIVLLREGTLPRTSLGKLQRKEFQSTWEKGKVKPLYISKEEASPDHHQLIDLNELEVLDFSSVEKVIIRKIKEVARVWVDPNVSLFDQIALESIQVVQLVNELSRTFNIDLSLTILEMCDTVEDITEYIHNAPEYQPLPANVVAFNQEKKQEDTPPVFLVHPARGGVHCYLELAREMDDMFYAISDDGNYASVEEKASAYCELIRQVQPVGPYTLGGYSFGGTLSLAMASLLERAGEDVRQVILIDEGHASNADFPDAFNESIDVSEFLEVIASDYLMAQEIDQLKASHKKGATLSEICQQISDPKIRELVLFEKEAYVSNIRLLKKWTPDFTYSGPVTLLKTKNLINHLEKRYTNVVPIPGNHLSIIRQPLVKEVSHLVTELLHESEQKVEEKLGVMG
ncbi:MAG: non-ribosomal peptide synthetase, partial [Bacteroidota bacterium]